MAVPLLSEPPEVENPNSKQLAVVVEPEVKEMIFKDSSFVVRVCCWKLPLNKNIQIIW